MSSVKRPAPSQRKDAREPIPVKTGCGRQRVAPAIPNCTSQPEPRPQSRAPQPARSGARTLDGESARRLTEVDPTLTPNTVASASLALLIALRMTGSRGCR